MDSETLRDLFPNCSRLNVAGGVDDLHLTGNPAGHTVAGTFYLIWGLWWMLMSFWIYFHEPQRRVHLHTSRSESSLDLGALLNKNVSGDSLAYKSWIPQPVRSQIPLEPLMKILLPALGIFVETFLDIKPDDSGHNRLRVFTYQVHFDAACGEFLHLNRLYHISLYLAFVVSGIVDLLSQFLELPRLTSQLFLCFAFYCQTVLFSYHVHGRFLFNVAVHQLLTIIVIATAVFATLRMLDPRNLLFNAGIAGGMIIQGTNLIQAGSLIYGDTKWNPVSHNNPKFIAVVTTWHVLGTGLFMIAVFVVMRKALQRKTPRGYSKVAAVNASAQEKEQLIAMETVEVNTAQC